MQVFNLTGIVDDGSNLNPRMPRNTSTSISIVQFGHATINVDCYYNSGVPFDLSAGSPSALLSVQRTIDPQQDIPELQVSATIAEGPTGVKNRLVFTIAPADTQMTLGRYFFDVYLSSGSNRWQVVRISYLILVPGLSR